MKLYACLALGVSVAAAPLLAQSVSPPSAVAELALLMTVWQAVVPHIASPVRLASMGRIDAMGGRLEPDGFYSGISQSEVVGVMHAVQVDTGSVLRLPAVCHNVPMGTRSQSICQFRDSLSLVAIEAPRYKDDTVRVVFQWRTSQPGTTPARRPIDQRWFVTATRSGDAWHVLSVVRIGGHA